MSGHVSRDARTVRLPEVSEWFAQQGLPYPDYLDAWLDCNTFGTVERLKLVDDADWRRMLQRCEELYPPHDFKVFKSSIGALRQMPFDELHDWTRDALPELPLTVYGSIGLFLTTRRNWRLEVGKYDIPARFALPSDVTNFCIAGGKEIADTVRFAYLHKNKQYLRRSILSRRISNVEAWMKENDWKSLVGSQPAQPVTSHAKYGHVTISRENAPFFQITENAGITSLEVYQDPSRQILQRRVTGIVYVNDLALDRFDNAKAIERFIWYEHREHKDVTLLLLQDPYSLFSDPVVAIDYKLTHVLQYMIESQYISPNDMFQKVGDPLTSDDAIKMPLLYHALFSRTYDGAFDCFDYLISLPNLDCRAEFLVKSFHNADIPHGRRRMTNIIFEIIKFQVKIESLAKLLKSVLCHPSAPDINGENSLGHTPLQEVCRVQYPGPYFNERTLKLLRLLLEHGADPTVKKANVETGAHVSAIDHLLNVIEHSRADLGYYEGESEYDSDSGSTCSDDEMMNERHDERIFVIKQMIWLLERHGEGPKRSADQPPITDYFSTKRRRVEF